MARPHGAYTHHRRVGAARQRAWNAMRVFKTFTTAAILPVADIGEHNLRAYLKALRAAGYLRLERAKRNGQLDGHAVWRLVRNSGPRYPIARQDGSGVWDPNHECVYPLGQAMRLEDESDERGTLDDRLA